MNSKGTSAPPPRGVAGVAPSVHQSRGGFGYFIWGLLFGEEGRPGRVWRTQLKREYSHWRGGTAFDSFCKRWFDFTLGSQSFLFIQHAYICLKYLTFPLHWRKMGGVNFKFLYCIVLPVAPLSLDPSQCFGLQYLSFLTMDNTGRKIKTKIIRRNLDWGKLDCEVLCCEPRKEGFSKTVNVLHLLCAD